MRIIILLLLVGTLQAQNYHTFNVPVSVGGATNASSLLTLNSTTQGFLIPRMTTAQRDAIPTPAVGLQIYNTETNTINIYNGTWVALSGGGGIGGTIAAGQVAFGSASNTISGSSDLTWNSTTKTLTLGSNIALEDNPAGRILEALNGLTIRASNATGSRLSVGLTSSILGSTGSVFILSNNSVASNSPFEFSSNSSDAILTSLNQVNHLNQRLIIRGGSSSYGGNTTTRPHDILIHGGQNTTTGVSGNVVLSHTGTESRGSVLVGISENSGARLHVRSSSTTNTSLSFLTQNSSATNTFSVGDAGRVTIYKDTESSGTQSSARLMVESGDANTNLVLTPKGTGAIIAGPAPDGTATGGRARGQWAVDLQASRTDVNQCAWGNYSVIAGGINNRNQSVGGTIGGGANNTVAWTNGTVSGGANNTVSNPAGVVAGGEGNTVSGAYGAVSGGREGVAFLYGQHVYSSGSFSHNGDAQTSSIRLRAAITGAATTELSSPALAILSTPTGTTSRVWNTRLQCVAIVRVQGTGGPAAGSVFSETMDITIKRIGSVTSIVNGTPMHSVSVSDVGMSGADFLVDADDTNEALRVRFQPPTIAAADTQIRAVCTVYLTEIGY